MIICLCSAIVYLILKDRSKETALRKRAEKILSEKPEAVKKASSSDMEKLVHELRVHQVELEMQNDELRKAQRGIEESRSKYVELYDFSPVGYFVFSETGKILEVNITGAELVGLERSSLVSRLFNAFVVESYQPVFREHLRAVLRSQGKERCEVQLMKKEGRPVFISVESISVKKGDRGIIRSAISDITDRKRAEEEVLRLNAELEATVAKRTAELQTVNIALKDEIKERAQAEEEISQSEKEFRAIFELSSVGMAQRDVSTGLIIRVNKRLCEITGYSAREILNQKDTMLTHPDDRERDQEVQEGVLKGESDTWLIEKRYVRKNGEVIWALVNGRVVRDSSGRPFRTVAVIQDITARKEAENQIRKLNEELTRKNLFLESANRELEAYNSTVSHDLKNPLVVMGNVTGRLIKKYREEMDAKEKEYLEILQSTCTRMTELVDDLLELSRVSKIELKTERVDLSSLAKALLEEYLQRDPSRSVEYNVAERCVCSGDRRLLQVALDNLLGNAWKFTRNRECARIEFGCFQEDGGTIYFVQDNGCGFDMVHAEKLFLPFQRLHRDEDYPGTGIGLASVSRIINRHGGRIWVKSFPGRGAIFYFTL